MTTGTTTMRSFAEPEKPARRAKRHRACYFWPIWKQFRFPSLAAFDMFTWGPDLSQYYVDQGADHPYYERATAALAALEEARVRYEAARSKLKEVMT